MEDEARMSPLTTSVQRGSGGPVLGYFCLVRQEREVKCMKIGKEEIKLCVVADGMIDPQCPAPHLAHGGAQRILSSTNIFSAKEY